jgi:hypothetical protein
MLVWGGRNRLNVLPGGEAYNPASDAWRSLSDVGAPSPRDRHTAVWTGTEMIIWGGSSPGGARYDPATDTWAPISSVGAPLDVQSHTAVWTGSEMLIWGGTLGASGAAYNPATDTWRPLPPAAIPPRSSHTAVWTGSEMLIWGGLAADGSTPLGDGASYNPVTDTWRVLPADRAPRPRMLHPAVWTGTEMLIWGGLGQAPAGNPSTHLADGAAYNPATTTWRPLPAAPIEGRVNHTAVWTGDQMLVWGGLGQGGTPADALGDGGRYVPPGFPVPPPPVPHDERYFFATQFRIDDDAIWAYFGARGGLDTFGYPVSRTFLLLGCPVQVFQRQVAQDCPGQGVQLLNLLDPEIFPYTQVNGSTFPAPDAALKAATPKVGDPDYATTILAFVAANAPNAWNGQPVNFGSTFFGTVTPDMAGTDDPGILGLLDLEVWGAPISQPMADPNNPSFVYQRFQRGILHYTAGEGTRGILLAGYLKSVLLGPAQAVPHGASLPPDLAAQSAGSRYFAQYCPGAPNWLCRPGELPGTDLTFAFEQG